VLAAASLAPALKHVIQWERVGSAILHAYKDDGDTELTKSGLDDRPRRFVVRKGNGRRR
jgi:hypothetical protein